MQASGFTVVAERINMLRYMSHFRSVHRGQFFTTMKTTAVRKVRFTLPTSAYDMYISIVAHLCSGWCLWLL